MLNDEENRLLMAHSCIMINKNVPSTLLLLTLHHTVPFPTAQFHKIITLIAKSLPQEFMSFLV